MAITGYKISDSATLKGPSRTAGDIAYVCIPQGPGPTRPDQRAEHGASTHEEVACDTAIISNAGLGPYRSTITEHQLYMYYYPVRQKFLVISLFGSTFPPSVHTRRTRGRKISRHQK